MKTDLISNGFYFMFLVSSEAEKSFYYTALSSPQNFQDLQDFFESSFESHDESGE